MKKLSIVLMLTIVLGMAGCDTGTGILKGDRHAPPHFCFDKELFDECREKWTEQGISAYSFDVTGYKYDPNTLFGASYSRDTPPDTTFSAHVTVVDGRIVSIENFEPDEMSWLSDYSKELDAYTWGAIPDIFDKMLSTSLEEASLPYPYVYEWWFSVDYKYRFPKDWRIVLYTVDYSPHHYQVVVSFEINNFQVNEPEQLRKWAKQGISDYSFDVAGYEYELMTPSCIPYEERTHKLRNIPPDAQFCAHVTVADGGIVSIENFEPDERPSTSISISETPVGLLPEILLLPPSLSSGELGAYTWGTIPDIIDKIGSIFMEVVSSPYLYDRDLTYDKKYGFPDYLALEIYSYEDTVYYYPPIGWQKGKAKVHHKVLLFYIRNFKVTENAP